MQEEYREMRRAIMERGIRTLLDEEEKKLERPLDE